jgi:hypothetical protein
MTIVKHIKLSLMNLTVGFVGLVVILVAFGITIHVASASASDGFPSYVSPTSNIEDLKAEAYDGCMSRLAGKIPEEKAASTCFDHVYENSEDKSDLPSQESSPGSSQNMAPEDDETELSEEGEEDNKDSHENREQTTEDQKDTEDAESDESSQPDEPEDQIMVIEGGKKVAEY